MIDGWQALVDAVLAGATHRESVLHGEAHWRCVAWTGLELLPLVSGCDPATLLLFALLHDSRRLNDGHDPDHGPRAADFARELHARGVLRVEQNRLDVLCNACARHTSGRRSDDPTVGACWDADRLNLWRVGVRPHPEFLSTAAARDPGRIARAQRFEGAHRPWGVIYDGYVRVAAGGADTAGRGPVTS